MVKKIAKITAYALLAFILLFIIVNILPTKRPDPLFTEAELNVRGNLTPENGFFIILGFMEPSRIDPQSKAIVEQYINFKIKKNRISEYQVNNRHREIRKEISFISHIDRDLRIEDWNFFNHIKKDKDIIKKESIEKFLYYRIEKLLNSTIVEDLNRPDEEEFPFLGLYWIKLYLRKYNIIAFINGLSGEWINTTEKILKVMELGQKISRNAKCERIFLDGIGISSDSLYFISEILNRVSYNKNLYDLIIQKLEENRTFNKGLKYALLNHYFYMLGQIDIDKPKFPEELDRKYIRYINAILYHMTFDANNTISEFNDYFIEVLNQMEIPPYKRTNPARFIKDKNPFWWFKNYAGRFYLTDSDFDVYYLINWYYFQYAKNELVIILAMLHKDKVPYERVQQYLNVLVEKGFINPFTGKSYIWNAKEKMIYTKMHKNEIYNRNSDKIYYRITK